MTQPHPPGATLHIGGQAWAHPDLEPLLVDIAEVTPFPGNPRRHDQDNITGSIRDHGLYAGVVCQTSTGHVMVGNGRRQALLDLGATRIPRTLMDVDDVRARAVVARDNQTSDASGNDDQMLLDLLAPLADDADLLALSGYVEEDMETFRRAVANLEFTRTAGEELEGTPLGDLAGPIDLDGDAEKVTITLDPGHRPDLYALLVDLPYIRNMTDAHVKAPK